tara:strand:- start:636 stop:908 length:273 start_codon:yes stop_codon:yes gene_type:complete
LKFEVIVMEEELNKLTLIGRKEIKGKKYPLYLERFCLIGSIIFTIYMTYLVLNNYNLPQWLNIVLSSCLAPLFALSLAEIIGRFIQSKLS